MLTAHVSNFRLFRCNWCTIYFLRLLSNWNKHVSACFFFEFVVYKIPSFVRAISEIIFMLIHILNASRMFYFVSNYNYFIFYIEGCSTYLMMAGECLFFFSLYIPNAVIFYDNTCFSTPKVIVDCIVVMVLFKVVFVHFKLIFYYLVQMYAKFMEFIYKYF